ncbi:MAG TPA: addiction module toxin, HicA family [Firmicutes bacterium]|nr:addiction module toxin, HicA family [Bacillota bacterium]
MPVVRARDVIRVVGRLGFVLDRQKGGHAVYYRARDGARIVVPIHQGKDIKPKTLAGIIKDMGITVEEFAEML